MLWTPTCFVRKIQHQHFENPTPTLSPQDFEILRWCSAGPVLPHGEKVPF